MQRDVSILLGGIFAETVELPGGSTVRLLAGKLRGDGEAGENGSNRQPGCLDHSVPNAR